MNSSTPDTPPPPPTAPVTAPAWAVKAAQEVRDLVNARLFSAGYAVSFTDAFESAAIIAKHAPIAPAPVPAGSDPVKLLSELEVMARSFEYKATTFSGAIATLNRMDAKLIRDTIAELATAKAAAVNAERERDELRERASFFKKQWGRKIKEEKDELAQLRTPSAVAHGLLVEACSIIQSIVDDVADPTTAVRNCRVPLAPLKTFLARAALTSAPINATAAVPGPVATASEHIRIRDLADLRQWAEPDGDNDHLVEVRFWVRDLLKSASHATASEDAKAEIKKWQMVAESERQAKLERTDMWMEKAEMLDWLHAGSEKDADGCEWGVYRVKWDAQGKVIEAWHTNSDLSDLRSAMSAASPCGQDGGLG